MPSAVQLRAVRLPGRESRYGEAPLNSVMAQVSEITARLVPLLAADPRPYGIVGACSGAITAYELAVRLETLRIRPPDLLMAISELSPARLSLSTELPKADVSADALLGWLFGQGDVPSGAGRPDMFRILEPMLRADIRALESYQHRPAALRCRVVAVRGDQDRGIDEAENKAWSSTTTGPFEALTVVGDHHLLRSAPAAVAQTIAAELCTAD
jgi:surfactin synthase thioesterase subunit